MSVAMAASRHCATEHGLDGGDIDLGDASFLFFGGLCQQFHHWGEEKDIRLVG